MGCGGDVVGKICYDWDMVRVCVISNKVFVYFSVCAVLNAPGFAGEDVVYVGCGIIVVVVGRVELSGVICLVVDLWDH